MRSSGALRTWLLLAGAVLTEVTATLSLKAALHHHAFYALVVAGYTCAFGLLALVLRRGFPLGTAYGVWGACGVALTALLGAVAFGETLSAFTVGGIALIVAGVLLIELGTEPDSRSDAA